MDFSSTKEQINLKKQLIEFAQQTLNANIIELDQQEEFNREGWKKCSDFGLLGLPIPKQYGGGEVDILTVVHGLEGLGYGCKDNGLIFSLNAHIWGCEMPILTFGTEEQKNKYLPNLCRGEFCGALAVSEPDAGSDVYNIKTTATKQGDTYLLNGNKIFVTNGPIADVIIVLATVAPSKGKRGLTAFIVEKGLPGFSVKRKVSKMGLRTAMMGELTLEQCVVPVENRLGKEGSGVTLFSHSMEWERGFILASAVGTMARLLEQCIQYARQRQQFGQPIAKFQLVANKIVDMKLRLETAKAMIYKVGWLKKIGKPAIMEAAMAKLYISESWIQCCTDAIQIHGGYGYLTELELERELRDAHGSTLYSGTSELQRQIISQFLRL